MKTQTEKNLRQGLIALEGRGYKAYKSIKGHYAFPDFTLKIDYVQGDPFSAPSRFRVEMAQTVALFPSVLLRTLIRRIALADYLTRRFDREARRVSKRSGTGNSGLIEIDRPGQEVIERTSALVNAERLELRFSVGLPARGRSILGNEAAQIINDKLPIIIEKTLKFSYLNPSEVRSFVETIEDAEAIRTQLRERGLVAFIADGAILTRKSGIDPHPLKSEAIPFRHPPSLRQSFERPNHGSITGMGIPYGVTLVVGGGYHGKSTLLRAIACGIYNHIPGDGREFVITDPDAVKIRAEDQRSITGVNITPFINHLPTGQSTKDFSTENASGSTSQAANIIEALELSAKAILIDEDTAATNFMIRDHRMQELIAKDKEPITPFIDKVKSLYRDHGVSTILVIGGSGDYFDTADTVIAMDHFMPSDVTEAAREIALRYRSRRHPEGGGFFGAKQGRIPIAESLDPSKERREVYLKVHNIHTIVFGKEKIDLSAVEQVVEKSQTRAIAHALLYTKERYMDGQASLSELTDCMMKDIAERGLDALTKEPFGDLACFRRFEWAAALNRLRSLKIRPTKMNLNEVD